MTELTTVKHRIQKNIIDLLIYTEVARFSNLRPPRTDTNLFTYHLKALIKQGLVEKVDEGYTLAPKGLAYVDRVSTEKPAPRTQPKVISMLLIQNSNGDILLQRRKKQPHINTWTLPYGKNDIEDSALEKTAQRVASERLGLIDQSLRHVGLCYIRVKSAEGILSTTTAHVFAFNRDDIQTSDDIMWARPHKLQSYKLAPAVEEIVARGFFNDPFFFEEFDVTWPLQGSVERLQ